MKQRFSEHLGTGQQGQWYLWNRKKLSEPYKSLCKWAQRNVQMYRWSIPKSDWFYSLQLKMEKPYTVSKNKTWSWLWLRSWIHIVKFSLKLKNVGRTTRPFRYDLNQITYDYTVEVTNRFKRLNLIECLKNYGWRFVTLYRKRWPKPSEEKERQEGKVVVWVGFTNSWGKKRSGRQERKGKIYPTECRIPENSKER